MAQKVTKRRITPEQAAESFLRAALLNFDSWQAEFCQALLIAGVPRKDIAKLMTLDWPSTHLAVLLALGRRLAKNKLGDHSLINQFNDTIQRLLLSEPGTYLPKAFEMSVKVQDQIDAGIEPGILPQELVATCILNQLGCKRRKATKQLYDNPLFLTAAGTPTILTSIKIWNNLLGDCEVLSSVTAKGDNITSTEDQEDSLYNQTSVDEQVNEELIVSIVYIVLAVLALVVFFEAIDRGHR
jgi:hypothetical protein